MREQTIGQKDGSRNSLVEHGGVGQKGVSYQKVELVELVHENGKFDSPKEKVEDKITISGEDSLTGRVNAKDMEDKMQWEEVLDDVAHVKSEEGSKQKQGVKGTGCANKENQCWAENESSPLAMTYDQEKGWTSEILGPKSGHWKRLARQAKDSSPTAGSISISQKRKGESPLTELDQNVKCTKKAKGKKHLENALDEEMQMVGGVAVAALQHRPAQ